MVVLEGEPSGEFYYSSGASTTGISDMDSADSQARFSPVEMPIRPWMAIELPRIGELRKAVRQRPKKYVEPTDVVTVPYVVGDDQANPFDIPDDIPGYMYEHLKKRAEVINHYYSATSVLKKLL